MEPQSEPQKPAPILDLSEDVLKALNRAYFIWLRLSESSREAQKAASVLRFVLDRAQTIGTRGPASTVPGALAASSSASQASLVASGVFPQLSSYDSLTGGSSLSPLYLPNLSARTAKYPPSSSDVFGPSNFSSSAELLSFAEMDFDWVSKTSLPEHYAPGLTRSRTIGIRGIPQKSLAMVRRNLRISRDYLVGFFRVVDLRMHSEDESLQFHSHNILILESFRMM